MVAVGVDKLPTQETRCLEQSPTCVATTAGHGSALKTPVQNPLTKLNLDYWYHALMAVSVPVFLLTGAGALKAFPTAATALISLGAFFVGLGEWINHPLQTGFLPPNAYQPGGVLTSHLRNISAAGITFLVLGLV
jgi:hypothetical protein